VVLIIAFAFVIGVLPFSLEVTSEMLARTKPTLIDLFVATLAGLRPPTPADIAAIEKHLEQIAKTPVSLSVWASTELIVTKEGYDSVQGHIREQLLQRRAMEASAAEAGAATPMPP
jgi:hypothetical protein